MNFYYCYDAYCGWCYGFSSVIKKITEEYKEIVFTEVLSGGMIITDEPKHIGLTADYIKEAYKQVEKVTGVEFGPDYLWHINNPDKSDWFPSSEKPAIALCIFKELFPNLQVQFATDLQYALHFEGRDLTDDEAYRHLLEKYEIDAADFYAKLYMDEYKKKAYDEFELCKQLKATGYPHLLMQTGEKRFHLLTTGYISYEDLKRRIKQILLEMQAN